jgi:hypothetical protein
MNGGTAPIINSMPYKQRPQWYDERRQNLEAVRIIGEMFPDHCATSSSTLAFGAVERFPCMDGYAENLLDIPDNSWLTYLDDPEHKLFFYGAEGYLHPVETPYTLDKTLTWSSFYHFTRLFEPATELYGPDHMLVRAGGQQRMDSQYQMVAAPNLTSAQAKVRAVHDRDFDASHYTNLRVRKTYVRFDPLQRDNEEGFLGVWVPCQADADGAHLYWQVTDTESGR